MAKPTKDVMIDLETLAMHPKAAVIQIGLAYRMEGDSNIHSSDIKVNPDLVIGNPFVSDSKTIAWHKADSIRDMNLRDCYSQGTSPAAAAQLLLSTIQHIKEHAKYSITLWACGTDFDIPIVTNLLSYAGLRPNWSYTFVRDYRTIRELFKDDVPIDYTNDHTAEQDAINQYQHLKTIRKHINREFGVW